MQWFQGLNISTRLILIILTVSVVVAVLIGGARLAWESQQARQALVQELSVVTRLLGDRSSAALAVDDARLGEKILTALQVLPHVVQACLYRNDATLLAEYLREGMVTGRCPPTGQVTGMRTRFEADQLHVAVTVQQGTQTLGWIYLGSDLSPINARLRDQLTFSGLALLAVILFAGLLAVWLQRLISRPVETLFRNLVESAPAIPWELDLASWCFTYVGPQAEAILGYPVEDWYQDNFWPGHIHPDDRNASLSYCQTAIAEMRDHQFEYRMLAADGHSVWIRDHVQVICENGRPVLVQGFMFDITERKRSEEAIRDIAAGVSAETGAAFFRHLVEHLARLFSADYAFIGVLGKDDPLQIDTLAVCAHGHIVDNISYSLEGTPCANVVGQSTCAYPSGVQQQFPEDQLLLDMGVEGYIGAPLYDSKGGALGLLVVLDGKPLQRINQVGELLEIFAARTGAELERMQAEAALRESEQQQRDLLNNTSSVIYMKDLEGRYLFINRMYENLFHISDTDIRGKTDCDIFPVEIADAFRRNDLKVIEADTPQEFEETVPQNDGDHIYISVKFPLKRASGEIYATCGISTDITERKQAEEALRRSQKMEAIGQLSGGIAHDFNNQLGIIIGYLDILKNDIPEDEKSCQWVDTATRAALRCMDLTRQLLAFSRSHAKEKTVVNLNTTLRELETMIMRSVTPEVEVQYFLTDTLWQTEIDPGEFQDVILNLVINARDAMPGGGTLLIETSNKHLDTGYIALNPELRVGDYVQLMLSDTGTGMNSETLEHVFEPFFTTKPEGKGTGLGLAMVYGFVKRYGGYIKVYSEPGVGTTIRLFLPRSTASESTDIVNSDLKAVLPGGNECILIVDDEVDLLALADQYLSDLGYRTRVAENATLALDILAKDEGVDLLFSDVVMPGGINGYELAQQASEHKPGLKILLTSGFTLKAIAHNGLARYSAHLLTKPYRKNDLAKQIRLVLDDDSFS